MPYKCSLYFVVHILAPLRDEWPIFGTVVGPDVDIFLVSRLFLDLKGFLFLEDQRRQVLVSQNSLDLGVVLEFLL